MSRRIATTIALVISCIVGGEKLWAQTADSSRIEADTIGHAFFIDRWEDESGVTIVCSESGHARCAFHWIEVDHREAVREAMEFAQQEIKAGRAEGKRSFDSGYRVEWKARAGDIGNAAIKVIPP